MSARKPIPRSQPPVSADSDRAKEVSGTDAPPAGFAAAILPTPMVREVSHKGRMVNGGYQPENARWGAVLTETVGDKRIGRDPMTIPPDVLTKAGHGPRRTSAVVAAIDMPVADDIKKYRDIREHCLDCSSGNKAEVRRCAIYDCAAWPYRTGKSPHNPRRGKNPFAKRTTPAT
jgi:hypothetical protein